MGLMQSFRSALGLERPLHLEPNAPLAIAPAARARLGALPANQGLHLQCEPQELGYQIVLSEGPSQGPSPDGYDGLTLSDADLARTAGLTLDYADGRWRMRAEIEVRPRETPNPHARLYLCSRYLMAGARHLQLTKGAENPPHLAARLLAIPGVEQVLLRANGVTIERTPGLPWDPFDSAVPTALRAWLLAAGQPLRPEDLGVSDDPLEEEVWAVLEQTVLPGIQADGGSLELRGVHDGVVSVHLVGACASCPASTVTLKSGIERTLLKAFPNRIYAVQSV